MEYISTRGGMPPLRFSDILLGGLAPDGGLVMPASIPQIDNDTLQGWRGLSYAQLAFEVLSRYCDDIPADDLKRLVEETYTAETFGTRAITPLTELEAASAERGSLLVQHLSNGPTLAFKDMAMQLLGRLFEYTLLKQDRWLNIVGATSGDTGSAAEYAMRGRQRLRVFMLSPAGRMSAFQRAQMFSLMDDNIHNIAIEGVFDDCQDLVKALASDLAFKKRHHIGSVNSINWARVVAQGQLRQRAGRSHRPAHGPAHPPPGGGHQRERRAGRVLPHRPLSRAQRPRDARRLQPVDGHLQGLQLRALRLRPARR